MLTVLTLPFNLIAGLFDMNVGGIRLAREPHGFAVILGVVGAFTALAGVLVLRRRGG